MIRALSPVLRKGVGQADGLEIEYRTRKLEPARPHSQSVDLLPSFKIAVINNIPF
jgi:hypothetical protein